MPLKYPPQKLLFLSDENIAELCPEQPTGRQKLDRGKFQYVYTWSHQKQGLKTVFSLAEIEWKIGRNIVVILEAVSI